MARKLLLVAMVALTMSSLATAQSSLTDLPDLSTTTSTSTSTTASTSGSTSSTSTASGSTVTSTASTTNSSATVTVFTSSGSVYSLTDLPTIAGAGIPTMVIPYTADAPFMQKSDLPEGTVFIGVGAVLAFLGACVLLWRGLVAWSINRSVKKSALASIRGGGTEKPKNWTKGGSGYRAAKGGMYKDVGNSMSMDALTSTGKPYKSHFRDEDNGRGAQISTQPAAAPPPANLFFSPTAHARTSTTATNNDANRNSSYLPAGYYAQPSSQAAGGARNTIIGGTAPPYARNSAYEPSPPASPALRPSGAYDVRHVPGNREPLHHQLYSRPSDSSLNANIGAPPSSAGYEGSRAPSAYLEDLFENHTAMASKDHI